MTLTIIGWLALFWLVLCGVWWLLKPQDKLNWKEMGNDDWKLIERRENGMEALRRIYGNAKGNKTGE